MPSWKYQPPFSKWKERDFWGDENQGQLFKEMLDAAFGRYRGARKEAMSSLKLQRRLLNMYITGERRVPDEVFAKLEALIPVDGQLSPAPFDPFDVWEDGIDPFS